MRVAVFFLSMLALTTSSQASSSCMSKTEARQHYGSVHIYWHGPDHCWDATPTRRRQARQNQPDSSRQVERADHRTDWRQARSEMLPDDGLQAPSIQTTSSIASANWLDRWIDIVPVVPRADIERQPVNAPAVLARESEPSVTPRMVIVLAFFALVLILATIEILFRNNEQER
jgi:hypothetical protein